MTTEQEDEADEVTTATPIHLVFKGCVRVGGRFEVTLETWGLNEEQTRFLENRMQKGLTVLSADLEEQVRESAQEEILILRERCSVLERDNRALRVNASIAGWSSHSSKSNIDP